MYISLCSSIYDQKSLIFVNSCKGFHCTKFTHEMYKKYPLEAGNVFRSFHMTSYGPKLETSPNKENVLHLPVSHHTFLIKEGKYRR